MRHLPYAVFLLLFIYTANVWACTGCAKNKKFKGTDPFAAAAVARARQAMGRSSQGQQATILPNQSKTVSALDNSGKFFSFGTKSRAVRSRKSAGGRYYKDEVF